jgi:hypothetical protein
VLEVASRLSTERTEETRSISHTIRVSFPVKRLIEIRIEQLLNLLPILNSFDIMFASTVITVAGAGEIAVLDSSRHPYWYVKRII